MADPDPALHFTPISYEEVQAHIARGRALQAEYVAAAFARLGRLLLGRGKRTPAKARDVAGHPA